MDEVGFLKVILRLIHLQNVGFNLWRDYLAARYGLAADRIYSIELFFQMVDLLRWNR